jgi:LysR family transcriptional regulator, glycine cleavage system transcriptional activator
MATPRRSEPDQTLIKMPSLRAVRSFVAAAKYQSFTRAAEALCVTQAAISRQIRELESYLGTELFVRTGRAVKLTADGIVFFDAAQLSFINIAQAAERLRSRVVSKRSLTVCCSPALSALWLQPRLPDFFRAHPDIELRVLATQDFLAMESSVRPDAFITKMTRVRDDYSSQRLFHDVTYPVCSPACLTAHGDAIDDLERMRDAELLDLSPYGRSQLAEHVDWSVWFAFHGIDLAARDQAARPVFSSNDYVALVHLALAGQGIVLGWDHLVGKLVEQGRLVRPVRHEVVHAERCHFLNMRTDMDDDSACQAFRDFILGSIAPG